MDVPMQRAVIDSLPAQLAVVNPVGTVVLVNEEWRRFAEDGGCSTCAEGANFFEVCRRAYGAASQEAVQAADGLRSVLAGTSERFAMDLTCETAHGTHWYTQQVVPLVGRGAGAVVSYTDITERKRIEALIEHRATHDGLTGLPNRVLIHDRLAQAIASGHRTRTVVGVLFVDVDRFKRVNDVFGHAVGDAVLVEVAHRLTECVRPCDTVGRLAGDEFVIICSASPAEQAARDIARRVRHVMSRRFDVAGHHLTVGVSIGIHVAGRWEGSPEDLLHLADTAMFRAKERGGGHAELNTGSAAGPASTAVPSPGAQPALRRHALDDGIGGDGWDRSGGDDGGGLGATVQRLLRVLRVSLGMDIAWTSDFLGPEQVFRFVDCAPGSSGPVPGTRLPLSGAYCARVLAGTMPSLIPDTQRDPDGTLLPVTFDLHIGSYLGVPLHGSDGRPTGMLCATSSAARPELSEADLGSAHLIARVIEDQHGRALKAVAAGRARRALRDAVLRFCRGEGRTLVLQPVVDLRSMRVVGAEALTRFDRPERDPAQWFATATSLGLGRPLEVAAAASAVTHETATRLPVISINLSPEVILDGALEEVLAEHDPASVIVEITEHAPVSSYEDLEQALGRHRARGLRLAVDDVGAGHASMTHVVRLHPDVVKVDMSLVRNVDADPVRQSLVAAIGSLGHRLHATVVAEGVETDAELQALRGLHVDQGQGYFFGRPSERLSGP